MGVLCYRLQVLRNFRLGEATRQASWVPIFSARIRAGFTEFFAWVKYGNDNMRTTLCKNRLPRMFLRMIPASKNTSTLKNVFLVIYFCRGWFACYHCNTSTRRSKSQRYNLSPCRKPSKSFITQMKVFVKLDVNSKVKSQNYV